MKIMNMECPCCGAKLNVDADRSLNFCEFCGSQIAVESARSQGYDMEMGRQKAARQEALSAAEKLGELKEPFINLRKYDDGAKNLSRMVADLDRKEASLIKNKTFNIVKTPLIVALVFWIILGMAKAPFGVWLLFALIAILSIPLSGVLYENKCKSVASQIDQHEGNLVANIKKVEEYKAIMDKYPDIRIPEKYHNERAIEYIRNALLNNQASTLGQAIAMCDEKNERMKQMELQEKQIALQQQQIAELQALKAQNQKNRRRR